nr:hypothetical protein [Volvox reticuliferus]BCL66280.1 hypothetical protein [Volvox reticuliferus]
MQTSHRVSRLTFTGLARRLSVVALAPNARNVGSASYGCMRARPARSRHRPQPPSSKRCIVCKTAPAQEPGSLEDEPSWRYLSDEEVDQLVSDAAGFVCVLDELRPLDPASFNPFYEVWTRIARIPPEERYRLLEELEPGSFRSLWRASMARYVLDEARSLELFADTTVWDDFPRQPGEVFVYEGRCESYQFRGREGVTLERVISSSRGERLVPGFGAEASSVPSTPWLRPAVGAPELQTSRFKQLFFVPLPPPAGPEGEGGGTSGGGSTGRSMLGDVVPPQIYSRMVLPLAGPLDRWWDPLYARLRVQLALTPLSRDAGADLQLLYPEDPDAGAYDGEGEIEGEGPGRERLGGSYPGDVGASSNDRSAGQGGQSEDKATPPRWSSGWALCGPDCLPGPGGEPGAGWFRWPDPDAVTYGRSPMSGATRDYLRVAGPGVYVGCAYREGPEPGELREENFVYFVVVRRYC